MLKYFILLTLLLFSSSCSNSKGKNQAFEIKKEIDSYLRKTMELHSIPGLALAVIEEDKIVYENYFGKASLENQSLVDKNTLFRIFSTTKLITSTGVFQLVQDGELNVEDTLSTYLDDLPIQWQQIQIKNLLSHSSGLPDMIRYESTLSDKELMENLSDDEMEFVAGSQFSYNQTNYWLLAQIIEKITGMTFDEYILENQFGNSAHGVLFSSNAQEIIPNRAIRYNYSNRTNEFVMDTNNDGLRGHPGNGLNITLSKFIEWDKKLKSNNLLGEEAKSTMWSPFKFTNNFTYQKDKFLHGWGLYHVNNLNSYGFTGGNLAAYRYFPKSKTTIILLSNGYQTPAHDIIVNDIARIAIPELKTKNLALEEDVMGYVLNSQFEEAMQSFNTLKEENPNSIFDNLKWNLNGIGNLHSWNDEPRKAFEVFTLNADVNPNWWVAIAGLAEMHEMRNDTLKALENYRSAIILNEKNEMNYNEQMKNKINELQK